MNFNKIFIKRICFIVLIMCLLFGCTSLGDLYFSHYNREFADKMVWSKEYKCLSDDVIQILINNHDITPSNMGVHKTEFFNKRKCTGLMHYGFVLHNCYFKLLLFEGEPFPYKEDSTLYNNNVVKEFRKRYVNDFTKKELDEISKEFLKGTVYTGFL